jgi:phage tail-like protein
MPLLDKVYASFFALEIDGVKIAFFTGCSGLNIEFDVATFKQVSGKQMVTVKIPGKVKYSEVVMKRGYSADMIIHKWFDEVVDAKDNQKKFVKTGSIVLYSREMTEVARFSLTNCWPSKLSVTDLNAGSSEVLVEELTIQHEMIDWVS